MPAGNDVMRPNYFCKSCKCYSILPSCPRETRQCRSNFHLLIRSLFIDTYLYRVSNIIIKIIKMVPRVIMLLGHFVYNVVVMKLAAVSNFMSYWFYYIMCITYVDRCRPMLSVLVRTLPAAVRWHTKMCTYTELNSPEFFIFSNRTATFLNKYREIIDIFVWQECEPKNL